MTKRDYVSPYYRAACGDGFSVFGSSNGIVITCGDGQSGCLGHGDDNSLSKPKLIEALLHIDVVSIACGPQHVAVVGSNGEAYTWGNGSHGRLGLGNEENRAVPQKVNFSEQVNITEVFCGETGTMFLTDVGSVWACGNNKYNKLGLNNRQGVIATIKSAFNKVKISINLLCCLLVRCASFYPYLETFVSQCLEKFCRRKLRGQERQCWSEICAGLGSRP